MSLSLSIPALKFFSDLYNDVIQGAHDEADRAVDDGNRKAAQRIAARFAQDGIYAEMNMQAEDAARDKMREKYAEAFKSRLRRRLLGLTAYDSAFE